jgi:hypothetical protein
MGNKFKYWFDELIIWFIVTVIFTVGLLTWDYYLDSAGLGILRTIGCLAFGMIVTYPTYTFWERKVKQFFNQWPVDNE